MHPPTRILLLEDEPVLRELMTQALSAQGLLVFAAGSAAEGEVLVKLAGWETFDVVITDVHLCRNPEEQNGYVFHRHWKENFPVPPFIFLSSGNPADMRDESCQVYHLAKPFLFPKLMALIRSVLCPVE
jgi:CheY-like chemotaxis protein